MPKNKNVNIKYTSREFATIKQDLIDHAERYYPESYKDFSQASFGSMVLDSVAYVGDVLSYYLDYNVNESFLDTAIEFDNIRKHARSLGYNYNGIPSSFGTLAFFVLVPSNSEGTAPDLNYLPVLKRGSAFRSTGGGNFVLTEDVDFNHAKNEFVAARFNSTTGATTHFAVKGHGQVQSGIFEAVTADLNDTDFEKFRRILIGGSEITEIYSVRDSEGNVYYEVDNLAQEVIFMETTNPSALQDGVRSILKPFVASRRFVLQRDDTGTYLQFGFGSEDEDTTGLIDPSRVALKMHGKNYISNQSFDPTKLLSTNKLGISPYNTTLRVVYRTNPPNTINAAANTITEVSAPDVVFRNSTTLSNIVKTAVINSIECTNEEPISSINDDITIEELKQRAKSHYSSQNRAVTKQDYESLVYNMPTKFGGIKRANVINDPSATNRRMALYVVSEDTEGKLATSNSITKINLKNWLSNYKMLNDVIDIFDATIINFSVEFMGVSDPKYNADAVLFNCNEELKKYFTETFYIGEPLYLSKIYQRLNRVEGVVDIKDVKILNKTGGQYSSVSIDIDEMMSRDGTYLKVPKNAILELKYPGLDIKGVIT